MAIIKCPECGNNVSNKAEICPHCGIKLTSSDIGATTGIFNQEKESTEPKQIPIIIPLIFSVLYVVSLFFINLETIQSIWMYSTGILLACILGYTYYVKNCGGGNKGQLKLLRYAFVIIFAIGAFFVSFEYNLSRMFNDDWVFEGYHFLDAYVYMESFTVVMVLFQLLSVFSVVMFVASQLVKMRINQSKVSGLLIATSVMGLFYELFEAVYLSNRYGGTIYSIYIETGVMIFFYYLMGATFSLVKNEAP